MPTEKEPGISCSELQLSALNVLSMLMFLVISAGSDSSLVLCCLPWLIESLVSMTSGIFKWSQSQRNSDGRCAFDFINAVASSAIPSNPSQSSRVTIPLLCGYCSASL
mmetsp:Transcript_46319/g.96902  ORF Transcript_46319/g.96902 Transcript_46319/m.96902 type:complete len:108 (+) Transcript_46319:145-468(+)